MTHLLNRKTRGGLVANILVPVIATLALNGIIFSTGLQSDGELRELVPFAPPGWFIGAVWVVLFALYGVARWKAITAGAQNAAGWITGLMIWALAYPFTSAGFDLYYGALANLLSLIFALFVFVRTWRGEQVAAQWLVPSLLWMIFANFLGFTALGRLYA